LILHYPTRFEQRQTFSGSTAVWLPDFSSGARKKPKLMLVL